MPLDASSGTVATKKSGPNQIRSEEWVRILNARPLKPQLSCGSRREDERRDLPYPIDVVIESIGRTVSPDAGRSHALVGGNSSDGAAGRVGAASAMPGSVA